MNRGTRRAASRKRKKLPKCMGCDKPILKQEPDVELKEIGETGFGKAVYYHPKCAAGAYVMVMLEPGAWLITHRHVDEGMN